jgi:hypothetical protein
MRIVALLVLLMAARPALGQPQRDRTLRILELLEELHADEATLGKLLPAITTYDQEHDRLVQYQAALTAKLRATDDPTLGDLIMDQQLATHRLLLAAEATLVTKLRRVLPASQAARARVLLFAPPRRPVAIERAHRRSYRRDDLFPPGSALTGPCDPFSSMHGC